MLEETREPQEACFPWMEIRDFSFVNELKVSDTKSPLERLLYEDSKVRYCYQRRFRYQATYRTPHDGLLPREEAEPIAERRGKRSPC